MAPAQILQRSTSTGVTPLESTLLMVFVLLLVFALLLSSILLLFKRIRARRANAHIIAHAHEKAALLESDGPYSPVPQIHLTCPDEKVVVVTISEKGAVGLEPLEKETLLPYMSRGGEKDEFKSLDLERMGGLRE